MRGLLGRIAYGLLFSAGWPAYLVALSLLVRTPWPPLRSVPGGAALAVAGGMLLLAGVAAIVRRGGGLPMNAFPPARLVTDGIYGLVPHPIYVGFCLLVAGVSLVAGSATGLYLGVPLSIAGSVALVWGYERPYLRRTFAATVRPLLALRGVPAVWRALLGPTQRLANSWSAVRLGRLRVINHAFYAGLAGGVGAALAVLAAGAGWAWLVAGLMVAGAIGAAAAGQLLVGSTSGLSRPFGYFGGLAAIGVAGLVAVAIRPDALVVVAAFCLAAPWTQALGRLRCLVQGCCHGGPAPSASGIVVTNPHSRACIAGLAGRPIHPTQLYSIVGNVLLGLALGVLWASGVAQTAIVGCYLAGAGVVRFVEEAYRGEPLTRVVRGLRLYQWLAVATAVAGLAALLVPAPPTPPFGLEAWAPAGGLGALFFVVCGVALGVDAPSSTRRFSRLSG